DFARLAVAAEPGLGLSSGAFMAAYATNISEANESALESSQVAQAVLDFVEPGRNWDGTAKELLEALTGRMSENARRDKAWPKSPRGLSNALKRAESNLSAVGLTIERTREGHSRKRVLHLCRDAEVPSASAASSDPTNIPAVCADANDGRD